MKSYFGFMVSGHELIKLIYFNPEPGQYNSQKTVGENQLLIQMNQAQKNPLNEPNELTKSH